MSSLFDYFDPGGNPITASNTQVYDTPEDIERRKQQLAEQEQQRISGQTLEEYVAIDRNDREQYDMWMEYNALKQEMKDKSFVYNSPLAQGDPDYINYETRKQTVTDYVNRRGKYPFPDIGRYERRLEYEKARETRDKTESYWNEAMCGDILKIPGNVKSGVEKVTDGDWEGDFALELKARALVKGYSLEMGGYSQQQVDDPYFIEQMADGIRKQGYETNDARPGMSVYKYLSERIGRDKDLNTRYYSLADTVRKNIFANGSGPDDLDKVLEGWSEEDRKQIRPQLAIIKSKALHQRNRVLPHIEAIKRGASYDAAYNDNYADMISGSFYPPEMDKDPDFVAFVQKKAAKTTGQPEEYESINYAFKAGAAASYMNSVAEDARNIFYSLPADDQRAAIEMLGSENAEGFLKNAQRSFNRGGTALVEGIADFGAGALSVVAFKETENGIRDDMASRRKFRDIALNSYRPTHKDSYGWFGNGVLMAAESVPMSSLAFTGYGIPIMAASMWGDSYAGAVAQNPDGKNIYQFAGAGASGIAQAGVEVAGARVFKSVLGFTKGNTLWGRVVEKSMQYLNLDKQAMRLNSGFGRQIGRAGAAFGAITLEEGITEKVQQLSDPFFHSLAGVMGEYNSNINWNEVLYDYWNPASKNNLELLGSVMAFGLVGAGARFSYENSYHRSMVYQEGLLKKYFDFSDEQLREIRMEEEPEVKYEKMQEGLRDFFINNYGKEKNGHLIRLSNVEAMRDMAAKANVQLADVYKAAEQFAQENKFGIEEVVLTAGSDFAGIEGVKPVFGGEDGIYMGRKAPRIETVTAAQNASSSTMAYSGTQPLENRFSTDGPTETAQSYKGTSFDDRQPVNMTASGQEYYRSSPGFDDINEQTYRASYVHAQNRILQSIGMAPIVSETNEFTGEVQHAVTFEDGHTEIYDDYNTAVDRVAAEMAEIEQTEIQQLKDNVVDGRFVVSRLRGEANEAMMQHLDDEGMINEGQQFDKSRSKTRMTIEDIARRGEQYRMAMDARTKIWIQQEGIDQGLTGHDLQVYGMNMSQVMKDGTYRAVQQLFEDANPLDVFEERVEGIVGYLLHEGTWRIEQFEQSLKQLEKATGDTYLAKGIDTMIAVKEGVAKAARANLIGQLKDERLPDILRKWFRRLMLWFGSVVSYRKEVERSLKLADPEVRKQIDSRFLRLLQDMAGLDENARIERTRQKEQRQIMADFYGSFDEIGEWAKGKLPHPKKLAEAGSDLTGEAQRIYDAMTTTVTRKGRRRKDGTIGKDYTQKNVFEAERYFSKDASSIADLYEAAMQAGFEFESSSEMLSALYDSLVSGRKSYATRGMSEGDVEAYFQRLSASTGQATFSIDAREDAQWRNSLRSYLDNGVQGRIERAKPIKMSSAPSVLQALGFSPRDLVITPAVLDKIMGGKHRLTQEHVEQLAAAIHDPILVIDSATQSGALVALTEIKTEHGNVIAAIHLEKNTTGGVYHVVASAYDKNSPWMIIDQIKAGKLRYIDKKRALAWARSGRLQLPSVASHQGNNKVLTPEDVVKWEESNRGEASFSVDNREGGGLWDYLAHAATHGITEQVRVMEKMKDRLESSMLAYGFTKEGVYKPAKDRKEAPLLFYGEEKKGNYVQKDAFEDERGIIQGILGTIDAIIETLPRDARAGLRVDTMGALRNKAVSARTERGRMSALSSIVRQLQNALDQDISRKKLEQLDRLMDWASEKTGQNRIRRGNLTVGVQRTMNKIRDIMAMDANTLEAARNHVEADIDAATDLDSPAYVAAVEQMTLLDTFGGLSETNGRGRLIAGPVRMDKALEAAKEIYTRGKMARKILDENRREHIARLKATAGKELGLTSPVHTSRRADSSLHDKTWGNAKKSMLNTVRRALSFENVLVDLFGEGETASYFAQGVRDARLNLNNRKMERVLDYYTHMASVLNVWDGKVTRMSDNQVKERARSAVDKRIAELSRGRDWGIEVGNPGKWINEKISPDDAARLIDGTLPNEYIPAWYKNEEARETFNRKFEEWAANKRKKTISFRWFDPGKGSSPLTISDMEAVSILLMSMQEGFSDNLTKEGYSPEVIDQIWEKIDADALHVLEYLRSQYKDEYPQANKVYREMFGTDMPQVYNYAPAEFEHEGKDKSKPGEERISGTATVGAIKSRVNHMNRPLIKSAIGTYWSHTMMMDHWIAFAPIMRDLKTVMGNTELGDKIADVHGPGARELINDWVRTLDFDGPSTRETGNIVKMVDRILQGRSLGALSYNPKTVLKQLPAAFASLADMDVKYGLAGLASAVIHPEQLGHIWKSDVIQQRIMLGMSPEMRQALSASRMKPNKLAELVNFGMLPISLADAAFTTFSGAIAYEAARIESTKKGMSDAEAEQAAMKALDRAVRRTAQPIETEQRSLMEIHAGRIGRTFMLFKSDPRKQFALSYMALAQMKRGEIGVGTAAWRVFNSWAVYGLIDQLIVDSIMWMLGKNNWDDDDWWKDYLISGMAGASAGIYGLGELANYIGGELLDKLQPRFNNGLLDSADMLKRSIKQLSNNEDPAKIPVALNSLGRGLSGLGLFAAFGRPELGAAIQIGTRNTKEGSQSYTHLIDPEKAFWTQQGKKAAEQRRITNEIKKVEKEEREAKLGKRAGIIRDVSGMDYQQRLDVYRREELSSSEIRYIETKLRREDESDLASYLRSVPAERRRDYMNQLRETMDDDEYSALVKEIRN